ncbi:TPA: hypothetical protein DDZ86_04985 [Candidatus Dependentiae bacterium]|nr:MAG: hypothetical protein A2Y17_09790 [Clostridiales bacterium GWF2_38_85]HBL98966.1 hypothetical protein [Candidatus Dependentiae bacterium]
MTSITSINTPRAQTLCKILVIANVIFAIAGLHATNDSAKQKIDAFIIAAKANDLPAINSMLESGLDINIRDRVGGTLLFAAVFAKNKNAVELLLKKGAKINAQANDGWTALLLAIKTGNFEIIKYLVEQGADIYIKERELGMDALLMAASSNDLKVVKYFIHKGSLVNSQDKNGWTPLLMAAQKGNFDMVKYLIKKGANVNTKDSVHHVTPLHFAALRNDFAAVHLLIKNGASITSKDIEGKTALQYAAQQGNEDVVGYLTSKLSMQKTEVLISIQIVQPQVYLTTTI